MPGGPDQQDALGDAAAQTGELLRGLEELDDLLEFGDGLVGAAHVLVGHSHLLSGDLRGLALAHAEDAAQLPPMPAPPAIRR